MKKKVLILLVIFIICLVIFGIAFYFYNTLNKENNKKQELPKVYLVGDIEGMKKKDGERIVSLKYESKDLKFDKYVTIKVQGSSSTKYEKKNYTIKLFNDEECSDKFKVSVNDKWGEQSKYCLKANWIDKTHSRNIVSAKIIGQIQKKYNLFNGTANNGLIEGFPVEMYINGEFLGLYTWNVPKDTWMWNMDKNNANNMIIQADLYKDQTRFKGLITNFDDSGWKIEIGDDSDEGKKVVTQKLNTLIDFVMNSTDEEFKNNFEKYFNKDSALNYVIGCYLMDSSDNYVKNLILATYDGNLWYLNLYDLDSTFGTNYKGQLNDYESVPENENNRLLNRIIECMSNELVDRWFELRKDIITKENILNEFNSFINSIPEESFIKEQERWKDIPGYGIEQIEEYLDFRLEFVDNLMRSRQK